MSAVFLGKGVLGSDHFGARQKYRSKPADCRLTFRSADQSDTDGDLCRSGTKALVSGDRDRGDLQMIGPRPKRNCTVALLLCPDRAEVLWDFPLSLGMSVSAVWTAVLMLPLRTDTLARRFRHAFYLGRKQ